MLSCKLVSPRKVRDLPFVRVCSTLNCEFSFVEFLVSLELVIGLERLSNGSKASNAMVSNENETCVKKEVVVCWGSSFLLSRRIRKEA